MLSECRVHYKIMWYTDRNHWDAQKLENSQEKLSIFSQFNFDTSPTHS